MALVDYASSDEDEEKDVHLKTSPLNATKRKRGDSESISDLPPLPSKFHDLYASTTRVSTQDDPSLHGGRKRVTPHVEGNWPTHLYIEWYPATAEYEILTTLISKLKEVPDEGAKLQSFLTSDLGAPLPLHVSLSRPIGFVTEKKYIFLSSLEDFLKVSGIGPFKIGFNGLDWVPNFEKTRWFLVLRLSPPDGNGLNKLLHICNSTVQQFDQPPLYAKLSEESSKKKETVGNRRTKQRRGSELKTDWSFMQDQSTAFHVSIAWILKPPSKDLIAITKTTAAEQMKSLHKIEVQVGDIKAKIGNVVTSIRLSKNVVEGKGFFGF